MGDQAPGVRRGRLVTPAELRKRLAARFGACQTRPLTLGMLLPIAAGAAEEQLS